MGGGGGPPGPVLGPPGPGISSDLLGCCCVCADPDPGMLISKLMDPIVLGEAEGVAPWVGVDEALEVELEGALVS